MIYHGSRSVFVTQSASTAYSYGWVWWRWQSSTEKNR